MSLFSYFVYNVYTITVKEISRIINEWTTEHYRYIMASDSLQEKIEEAVCELGNESTDGIRGVARKSCPRGQIMKSASRPLPFYSHFSL